MKQTGTLTRFIPILRWLPRYNKVKLVDDMVAAVIVAIMLIPQALAYTLVAGMPAETGRYASLLGLTVYCVFGTSNTLSVAPVAVVSLMTAAALAKLELSGVSQYTSAAFALTFLSGAFLLMLGLLRLGFMANFIPHPVISAFITAAVVIIVISQVRHLLGVEAAGQSVLELVPSLLFAVPETNLITLTLGLASITGILWCKHGLATWLRRRGVSASLAGTLSRAGPVLVAVLAALLALVFRLDERGVQLLGDVPAGLPHLQLPAFTVEQLRGLLGSAVLIAIIGFVESISVAQVMAAKRRERIDLGHELVGLGPLTWRCLLAAAFL